MGKRNVLAPPRGGVTIHMTKRQARKLLAAINGPSVTDADLAAVYATLHDLLSGENS